MTKQYKRVLVTGGGGCIGLQVCQELCRVGVPVSLLDLPEQILRVEKFIPRQVEIHYGSILDCSSLRDAMAGCDAVVHLAAYLGVRRTETNRLRCLEININGTKNVLDCSIQHHISKVVLSSSSEVYGEPHENPVTEETPVYGKTVYAVTKLAGEELCRAYSQRYPDLEYTILRYFNTYGPWQTSQFVIPKFIQNVMEDKQPVIYGDGRQKRSYCYASDTARATVQALQCAETHGEIFNVGNSSNPLSLTELAEIIIDVCGKKDRIEPRYESDFDNSDRKREREIFVRYCDTSKAFKTFGYKPEVAIRDGVKQVVDSGVFFPKWESTDLIYTMQDE